MKTTLLKWILSSVLLFGVVGADIVKAKEKVIFDTDIGPDWDDVGATATLHALADRGEAEILAMMVSSGGHSATWGPPCLDAFNTYYGRPDIPIGVAQNGPQFGSRYNQQIAEEFTQDLGTGNAWDAVELYRKTLSSQPDSSVVIITTGFMTNIAGLLKSGPDTYSGLNGIELVRKKVIRWVCMGGGFPSTGGEFNFNKDAAATKYAVENWPRPVLFSGFEIGAPIHTGAKLAMTSELNPIRRAYELAGGYVGSTRSSWDQTAVLAAVRDPLLYWDLQTSGFCYVADDGSNTWYTSPDKDHSYLIKKLSNDEMTEIIDNLMANLRGLPTVSIDSPAAGESFTEGADISIETTTADSNGQVVKVEFYARGSLLGTDSIAPFTLTWHNAARGGYYLTAKAYDNAGNWTISRPVKVYVGELDKSFVGYWKFENNAADSSDHGNDGQIAGDPAFVSGPAQDTAIQFFSNQDFVSIPASPDFSTTSFTLTAWVKIPQSIPGGWRTIVEHNRNGSNWFGLWKSANGNKFHFRWASSGNATADFSSTITSDKWYHVAGTFDASTRRAKLYLDGKLDRTVSDTAVPAAADAELRIGLNMDGNEDFQGIIDEVRIYNRVLSEAEIKELLQITSLQTKFKRLPQYYSMKNYPNPFNPSTKIQYTIPVKSHVTIEVYDIAGSKLQTLVDEKKQAGTYTVGFYKSNLASGIYLYTLRTENFQLTGKMVYVR